ncbi:DYNc [Aspergillus sclerotialis]|uniref:DYNc n=1 Tax=Aspergillus sclerotialis TaxID=2070753 RepID=A0A3A2ZP68_9EURO|nr:DYNc [Aspergillus sclerotialis]
MANAMEQLRTLLKDERRGPLQTVNHYFADNLAATREERFLSKLKKRSNDEQAVDDIHDILKSFYKVAMKRFNDNVVVQVVERCILGDEGAFQALTPEIIGDMSDRALEDIAGENYAISSARNELVSKIDRFQRGMEITR